MTRQRSASNSRRSRAALSTVTLSHEFKDLRCNIVFQPLQIRATVAFRPPEHDHRVRSHAQTIVSLHGIPKQVPCNEHLCIVTVLCLQSALDRDDPAKLQGMLSHRLSIALRVNNLPFCRLRDRAHADIITQSVRPIHNRTCSKARVISGAASSMARWPRQTWTTILTYAAVLLLFPILCWLAYWWVKGH